MTIPITGADPADTGPAACVARFIIAGVARDSDAAAKELHPDSRAKVSGSVSSPPGITAVVIDEPTPRDDGVQVPTRMTGPDGSEQPFVFVVRPVDDAWGVDLEASMAATFGGDPMQMMEDALRTAVAPLGEAMEQIGSAIGEAFGGNSSDSGAPAARRIAADATLPEGGTALPATATAKPVELELRRQVQLNDGDEQRSNELTVRIRLDLDPAWTATSCLGVTLDRAVAIKGEDLLPADAPPDLGSESYASWEQERCDVRIRFALAAPKKAFTGLAELAGTARLAVVGGELLELVVGPVGDLIGKGATLAAFGVTLEASREEDNSLTLRAPYGFFDRLLELRPLDANGETVSESWSGSGDGETSTRTYQSEIGDDFTLVLRFWAQVGTAEVAFTCEDLPLKL